MTAHDAYFNRMLRGEVPPPAVATLLGGRIEGVDLAAGTLSARYEGSDDFRNPAGQVAGGMLGAMLDDLTASLVDATLAAGEGVATVSLNVSFLRPAELGVLQGQARMIRRGRDLCQVSGTLSQNGKDVAVATAVCKIVRPASASG